MLTHCSAYKVTLHPATIVFALCGMVSCGGGHTSLGTSYARPAATFALSPQVLTFENVAVGKSGSTSATLTDTSPHGAPSLVVTKVVASGSGFKVKSPTTPITLANGQSLSLIVIFTPVSAGRSKGRLTLSLKEGGAPVSVELSGMGVSGDVSGVPEVSVSPASIDFGTVVLGRSENRTGVLTAGAADVNVSTATWDGPDYSLSGITLPTTLHAGSSLRFTVSFTPHSAGRNSAQLSFFTDASNSPTVSLSGSAVQASKHSVELSWNPSTSVVKGYNIYRRTDSEAYKRLNKSPIVTLTFTDDTTQSETIYHYVVSALNHSGNESKYSNEVTAKVP